MNGNKKIEQSHSTKVSKKDFGNYFPMIFLLVYLIVLTLNFSRVSNITNAQDLSSFFAFLFSLVICFVPIIIAIPLSIMAIFGKFKAGANIIVTVVLLFPLLFLLF